MDMLSLGIGSWIVAFVLIALLVIAHEALGHFFFARLMGMKVTKASLFFGPYLWKKEIGGTEYRIGATPLGGSVNILGFTEAEEVDPAEEHLTYRSAPAWKQMVVIAAGPIVNIVLGILIIGFYFSVIGAPGITKDVKSVVPNSPAAAQMRAGDKLISVNGKTGDAESLSNAVALDRCVGKPTNGCKGKPLQITFERNGKQQTFSATPTYDAQAKRMRIGFVFGEGRLTKPVGESFGMGFTQTWAIIKGTVAIPKKVFTEERKELGSIVGAYETTRQATKSSFWEGFLIAGVVSLALGIINGCLPLLPLDFGHFLVSAYYGITKKKLSLKFQERWAIIGLVLIAILFAIGLTNDIGRIFDGTLGQLK